MIQKKMAMGLNLTEQDNLYDIWFQFNKAYSLWPSYEDDCNEAEEDLIDTTNVEAFKLSLLRYVYPEIRESTEEFSKTALRSKIRDLYYNNEGTNDLILTREQCSLLFSMFLLKYSPTVPS